MDQLVRINLLAQHRLRDANGLFSGRSRRKSSTNTLGEACAITADPWCQVVQPFQPVSRLVAPSKAMVCGIAQQCKALSLAIRAIAALAERSDTSRNYNNATTREVQSNRREIDGQGIEGTIIHVVRSCD